MNRHTIIRNLLFLLTGAITWVNAEPTLSIGTISGEQGQTVKLDLSLSNGEEPYAGVNAKIHLPPGVTATGVSLGTLLSENFSFDWHPFTEGESNGVSVIFWSGLDTITNASGNLLSLELKIANDAPEGEHLVMFATMNDNPLINSIHAISNADGSVSVTHSVANGSITIIEAPGDADNDGLPDTFEQQIIDFNLNDAVIDFTDVLPGDDFDNDGISNLDEFTNGWDPTDPTPITQFSLTLNPSWNLVSIPLDPINSAVDDVFQNEHEGEVWYWNGTVLEEVNAIVPGKAYWVYRKGNPMPISVQGRDISTSSQRSLHTNWNAIGSIVGPDTGSNFNLIPFPLTAEVFSDPSSISGPIWWWNGTRFKIANQLSPGIGYFIFVGGL